MQHPYYIFCSFVVKLNGRNEVNFVFYNTGDTVVYGSSVCNISGIKEMRFGTDIKQYYILKPIFEPQSTVYHPVDGDSSKLRPPISADEARRIVSAPSMPDWESDDRLRREEFLRVLHSGSCAEVVSMIKLICRRKREVKKLRAADERSLSDGKGLVAGELAYALGITKDEAIKAITD